MKLFLEKNIAGTNIQIDKGEKYSYFERKTKLIPNISIICLFRNPEYEQNVNIGDPYENLMNKFKVEEEGDYFDDYLDLYNNQLESITKQLDNKEVVNALSHQSVSPLIALITTTQNTNRIKTSAISGTAMKTENKTTKYSILTEDG